MFAIGQLGIKKEFNIFRSERLFWYFFSVCDCSFECARIEETFLWIFGSFDIFWIILMQILENSQFFETLNTQICRSISCFSANSISIIFLTIKSFVIPFPTKCTLPNILLHPYWTILIPESAQKIPSLFSFSIFFMQFPSSHLLLRDQYQTEYIQQKQLFLTAFPLSIRSRQS